MFDIQKRGSIALCSEEGNVICRDLAVEKSERFDHSQRSPFHISERSNLLERSIFQKSERSDLPERSIFQKSERSDLLERSIFQKMAVALLYNGHQLPLYEGLYKRNTRTKTSG